MKASDAIMTVGLLALGAVALWWIYGQYTSNQATAMVNQEAAINIGELQQAAAVAQAERIIGQTTTVPGTSTAPVTTAPAQVNPTITSSGQQ